MGVLGSAVVLVVAVTIVALGQDRKPKEDETCRGSLQCMRLSDCDASKLDSDFSYECGVDDGGNHKICCAAKQKSTASLAGEFETRFKHDLFYEDCGTSTISNKIANGKNASIGEFPWMALLGYTTKKLNIPQYLCGGTLINQRYILTAAHCTFIKGMKLSEVRLGDVNLELEKECQEEEDGVLFCADPPLDIPVEKVIPHPGYSNTTLKNDIAIIRLARNITEFTEFVRPICMPFNIKVEGRFLTATKFFISGWGKTSSSSVGVSTILQFTSVSGWDTKKCNRALPMKVRPLNASQFCATGKDFQEACKGDSGGPITVNMADGSTLRTYQVGIVSFKSLNTCGSEELPTVFTRLDSHLDWLLGNMLP